VKLSLVSASHSTAGTWGAADPPSPRPLGLGLTGVRGITCNVASGLGTAPSPQAGRSKEERCWLR
jgi:hypothetical protein